LAINIARLDKKVGESDDHKKLKLVARNMLIDMGFNGSQIYNEYPVSVGKRTLWVDVVGISDENTVAIECGQCDTSKITILKMFFDKVVPLPYCDVHIDNTATINKLRYQNKGLLKENEELRNKIDSVKNEMILREGKLGLFKEYLILTYSLFMDERFQTKSDICYHAFPDKKELVDELIKKLQSFKEHNCNINSEIEIRNV